MTFRPLTYQLRYFKGNIIYYYFSNGKIIRLPLMKVENVNHIDIKSCLFKVKPYDQFNQKIKDDHDKISSIIYRGIEEGKEITRSYILEQLKFVPKNETPLTELFTRFIKGKEEELLSKETIKDYNSCLKVFEDFQDNVLKEYTLSMVDREMLLDFRKYLLVDRHYNDNSIRKRFKTLSSFMKTEGIDFSTIKPKLQLPKTEFVVLDRKELQLLKRFKKFSPKEQVYIDLFILNCLMGLRFGDLSTLDKGSFIVENNEPYYYKTNEKTNQPIKIYIVKTAKEILEKYNYKLPIKLNNQVFNREIKNIFRNHDLFSEKVKLREMVGNNTLVKEYEKRAVISSHTCRRTFITLNIMNFVDIPSIMKMTGHTQLSTLNKYFEKKLDIKNIDI
jgi:integrase